MFKSLKLFYRKENICQNLQRLPSFVLKCLFHCIPMQRILESCYSGSRDTVTLHSVSLRRFKKTSLSWFFKGKLHILGIFLPKSPNHPSPHVRLRTNLANLKMFRYLWWSSKYLCISSHFISTDFHFIFKDFLRPSITCCSAQDRFAQFCENSLSS